MISPPSRAFIGTSGWNYRDWGGGAFYPVETRPADWLGCYAERFEKVEANNTFYRLPETRHPMKASKTKHNITEDVVGTIVRAAMVEAARPKAGGSVGSQAAARTPRPAETKRAPKKREHDADDPIVHAQLKRILVPLDFSSPSRRALRFAREWAARFGSEVCLLHVIEPMNTYGILGIEPIIVPIPTPDPHEPIRAELEKLVHQEFPDSAKVSVHLRDGVAYDEIVAAARELAVDLIIIATHGRSGLSRALLGSTAERVVRHATCPVLTLRRAR